MNDDIVIAVKNLTKIYKLYQSPRDRLKESLHWRRKKYHQDFHALKDIDFQIKKGEIVGIIGKNGSGKSTLLKLITGVLTPTHGAVTVNGRISALLELGAGFNPQYTGLENIYFQGSLMGLSKEAMALKLPDILEFADIGEFVHQPVRSYSSGMFARLAFAVAIHVDPDILIVDEALSVGDMAFQAKCMARMLTMLASGVTVLFVSHDTHSVKSLCTKALFLNEGKMVDFGDAARVVEQYISRQHMATTHALKRVELAVPVTDEHVLPSAEQIAQVVSVEPKTSFTNLIERYGDGRATILNAVILDEQFRPVNELISTKTYYAQIAIRFNEDLPTFACGVSFSSLDGIQQLTWINTQDRVVFPSVKQGDLISLTIKIHVPIKAGVYRFNIGVEFPVIMNQQHQFLDVIIGFDVVSVKFEAPDKMFSAMFRCYGQYFIEKIEQ